ncbi:MAG: methionyl-tRNA formyltransferase [Bacteroidales bacterium]|jgi:methionyl-tRNA formyltransferase|nr:methionyl-tRNA formyltransferase [Bacteroidales bacterium]
MRIVFMGTPDFATGILKSLVEDGKHEIAAVVTATDKPAGRGMKLQASSVKIYAQEKGLKILQPDNLKDEHFLQSLQQLDAQLFVVVAFRMLPKVVWGIPPKGTINLHASLLPDYRGAAPINWAIINGEVQTGVTTFFINEKMDAGEIILQKEVDILPSDNAGSLHDKLLEVGKSAVIETLNLIENGSFSSTIKNEVVNLLKLAPKIYKENCQINWNLPAEQIQNLVRGLSPYPSAFTTYTDKNGSTVQMKIFGVKIEEKKLHLDLGKASCDDKNYLKIGCADGEVFIEDLQIHGKKRMFIGDFLRGNKGFEGVLFQ